MNSSFGDNKACYSPLVVLALHSHKSVVSKEGMLQILTRLSLLAYFCTICVTLELTLSFALSIQ